jgi:drug/metabolite transporter (DMT)-like permease
MNPALWGSLSALSLGTSDFAARFTTRAMGADVVYLAVLGTGSLILTLWVFVSDLPLVLALGSSWLLVVSGVATALMSMLLYTGLARGPISVVAPIVAANPVLVILFWVALGAEPTAVQWLAMSGTLVGALLVARSGRVLHDRGTRDPEAFRLTLWIAGAACLTHAVMVVAGQAAVPVYGDVQTLWVGRLVGLAFMVLIFAARRTVPKVPLQWWPLLIGQGCLDAGGYLFLFAGSHGDGREIAAVTGSAFGAVTVLLAWMVLREKIRPLQWLGVALVFVCIATLAGG